MLTPKNLDSLNQNLLRIFALPITHSTFREIQTVLIATANNDKNIARLLLETLLNEEIPPDLNKSATRLKKIIKSFSFQVNIARDVFEKGEFVNIITSDTLTNNEKIAFLNRVRRIDGVEWEFMTDTASTIYLLHHFANRLQELHQTKASKDNLKNFSKELKLLQEKIDLATKI